MQQVPPVFQPLCAFISRCSLQHLQGQRKNFVCIWQTPMPTLKSAITSVTAFAACAAWLQALEPFLWLQPTPRSATPVVPSSLDTECVCTRNK